MTRFLGLLLRGSTRNFPQGRSGTLFSNTSSQLRVSFLRGDMTNRLYHQFTLPSGLELCAISSIDAALEAKANEGHQVYFGESSFISLQEGGTVIDAGANIGSFSRMAAQALGASGRVVAVEPLPEVAEALRRNAAAHAAWAAAKGLAAAPICVVEAGLGDGSQPSAPFTYYPACTALSTMYEDVTDVLAATASIVRNSKTATSLLQRLAALAAHYLPHLYTVIHGAAFSLLFLRGASRVACPLKTVSQLIEELDLRQVSLLKINVERAELDVLRGVRAHHWPLIQQVSMQLHDFDGRLEEALRLLRGAGAFTHVTVHKEPRFADCCLVMVYARR